MIIIFEDIIINTDNIIDVYMSENNLIFEADNTMTYIRGFSDNALQQIAVAFAEQQKFIELEGKLYEPGPTLGSSGDTSDDAEFGID